MKPFEENVLFDVTEAKSWINMSSVFHFNSLFQKYLLRIKVFTLKSLDNLRNSEQFNIYL